MQTHPLKVGIICDKIIFSDTVKEKIMSNEWNNYDGENGEQDYAFQTLNKYGRPKTLGWSVASLVLGAVSLFTCFFGFASIVFGVLAIAFALWARKTLGYFDGKAIIGLLLGIFGTVFGVAMVIFVYTIGAEDQKFLWDMFKGAFEDQPTSGTGTGI